MLALVSVPGPNMFCKIVKALLLKAENLSIRKIDIYPHEHLKGFYESYGFKYIEKSEVVGNHQLIKMGKTLRP